MKVYYIVLLLFFAVLLSDVAAGDLPAGAEPPEVVATDGNHFYQEITVSSASAVTDAVIFLPVPYPFGFSDELQSYRFYDAAGNLLQSHVFAGNTTIAEATVKLNLTAGENTIWVTAGNGSLESVQDTAVYAYYVYKRPPSNETVSVGNCNGYLFYSQMNSTAAGDYNVSFGSSSSSFPKLVTSYYNRTNYGMDYYDNASNAINMSGSLNETVSYNPARVQVHRINSKSINYISAVVNSRTNTTQNMENTHNALTSTNFSSITYYSINGPDVRISLACAYYSAVTTSFGDWKTTNSINGVYVRVVDSIDAMPMNAVNVSGDGVNIGGSLTASATNGYWSTYGYQVGTVRETKIRAFEQNRSAWGVLPGYVYNLTTVFKRPTSVVFFNISDIPSETYVDLKPQSSLSVYNNSSDLNEYNITISPKNRIYSVPLTHSVNSNRTGIFGQVVDRSGNPVSNATVIYTNATTGALVNETTTAGGGMFGFANFTENSSYYIEVNKPGYISNSTLATSASRNISRSAGVIVLDKLYNITITAVDAETGQTINTFTTFLGANQSIKSTDNGTVSYTNVPGGETEVIVQASGYNQISRSIYIGENSTDFVLYVSKTDQEIWDTANYVRIFYRTYTGAPVAGLNVSVWEGNETEEMFGEGITGVDGSVAFKLDRTIKYTITAVNESLGVNHTFSVYPKSDEYVVWVGAGVVEAPSDVLTRIVWNVSTGVSTGEPSRANVTFAARAPGTTETIGYNIVIYQSDGMVYYEWNGTFSDADPMHAIRRLLRDTFPVTVVMTFTDEDGRTWTVSQTLDVPEVGPNLKIKWELPGFTQQWHYSCLCVVIIVLSGFTLSEKTKNIGIVVLGLEFIALVAIGWMTYSALAFCLVLAGVMMAILNQLEKVDKEG